MAQPYSSPFNRSDQEKRLNIRFPPKPDTPDWLHASSLRNDWNDDAFYSLHWGAKLGWNSLPVSETAEISATAEVLGPVLARRFKDYRADAKRSILQVVLTGVPFMALLVLMAAVSGHRYWLTLLLAVPAAGLLVRLFIMQHDCGHGSFFRSRAANDFLGRALSLLTLTPYGSWAQGHAAHHASAGNLDRRGRGDVETWTVAEYRASTPLKRLFYRLYRNPFVMVGLGAPINFIVLQRLPLHANADSRRSILGLDFALVVAFGILCANFGVFRVLGTYFPVIVIASWFGNWLFYVQHQFDKAEWEREGDWNFHVASLSGSSYFKLPPMLRWFSGNIGLHHVHHLCSRVPNYHLQACVDAAPELDRVSNEITLRESVRCWRLALWDERRGLLVGFRELQSGGLSQKIAANVRFPPKADTRIESAKLPGSDVGCS